MESSEATADAAAARPSPGRTLTSADRVTARAATIVDDVLTTTALRNERGVAIGRLLVCIAFLLREFGLYAAEFFAGEPEDVVAVAALVIGVVASVQQLFRPGTKVGPLDQRSVSVVVDILVWASSLWAQVLNPGPHYRGIFLAPVTTVGVLVVVVAGLRLERRFVLVGAAGAGVVLVVGGGLDRWLNANAFWGLGTVVFFTILYGGAAYLADLVARRTQSIALDAARQAFDAERTRERFGAYVGAEVAALALASRDVVLGGRRQPVAVLFCDLRGFTSSAEQQQPEEVVRQLNAYFEVMVAVIEAHGGVVDKYVGDAIMAVFGAPTGRPDDARRAMQAALAMPHALRLHNARRHMDGLPSLRIGVGVHWGEVVAGNIGTTRAAQYTVIGDVVNLASRLESATREHGVPVLFSQAVVDAAGADGGDALPVNPLGRIQVKGRAAGVFVYAPADVPADVAPARDEPTDPVRVRAGASDPSTAASPATTTSA
jgi:class 3 adenylate cyclase